MKKNKLFHNGRIYTQASNFVADSMAVSGNTILAVGRNLLSDGEFNKFQPIDLKGKTVVPGFTDAHTHFAFLAVSLGNVKLDGLKSLEEVLGCLKNHCRKLKKNEWLIGEGFSPDQWDQYIMPDRYILDEISGGRPAAIFSKDTHLMWANSKALEIAGYNRRTKNPQGGQIERFDNNEPSGILKEISAYFSIYKIIKRPGRHKTLSLYNKALKIAYSKGLTAVHSFDKSDALDLFVSLAEQKQIGLRINYYPPANELSDLIKAKIGYNYGDDYFRISGVKLFADGALGSQTALCFNKYIGSDNNLGIEVSSKKELLKSIKTAARLNLPAAIHAIGDKALANVLDCFEKAPKLKGCARHRIEHAQMIRRKDIPRFKRLNITSSMQPSHCPSDIELIKKYWGSRGKNCYLFKTFLDKNIPLAFGSDAPIEPLDPIAGIDAAVNRKSYNSKKPFYPEERLSVAQAVYGFTVGAAYAVGQEQERGFLLPGYKADFVILSANIYKIARSKIRDIRVIETYFDGKLVYSL